MDSIPGMRGVPLGDEQRALLKNRRIELGLTQNDLGEKIGRKALTIHTIEAGKYLPSPTVLAELCKVLSLDCKVMIEVHLSNAATSMNWKTQATVHKRRKMKTSRQTGKGRK